jgi:hypothetical protein
MGDGELVHHGLFDAAIRVQDHWVKSSRQNSKNREMVNWFTMILFDVEIRLQDHYWVRL